MSIADREKWDAKYADTALDSVSSQPDEWLVQCVRQFPAGRALDVACGLGHNALWLARHGWRVDAVDISPEAIERARRRAHQLAIDVNWIVADFDEWESEADRYELICVFRFLDRERLPGWIPGALRKGGLLCYETFLESQLQRSDNHLTSQRFALRRGELPALYRSLDCLAYEEAALADRDVARYLGRSQPE